MRYGRRMPDSVERLYDGVIAAKHGDPTRSRTARLLRSGRAKMAKKLAEEAVEVVIDTMNGEREAVVRESADLIYNLTVLWVSAGVRPQEETDYVVCRLFGDDDGLAATVEMEREMSKLPGLGGMLLMRRARNRALKRMEMTSRRGRLPIAAFYS